MSTSAAGLQQRLERGGFIGFMRGFDTAIADWRELLGLLDALRSKRQMSILGLVHTRLAPFKNPTGADFDRFVADMHHKTWGLTHKWADMVLFATFFTETKKAGGRHKGVGGQERILFTERHAAYDAKNRQGLPELIHLGRTPAEGWGNFREALKEASGRPLPVVPPVLRADHLIAASCVCLAVLGAAWLAGSVEEVHLSQGHRRGYDHRWREIRARKLPVEPVCERCRVAVATDVHHRVEKRLGGCDEGWNLESLCRSCHSRVTAVEKKLFREQ